MSTEKKAVSPAKADKLTLPMKVTKKHLDDLAAANKAKWEKLNLASKIGIVVLCVLAQIFAFKVTASMAVLYIFAHNGKFSGRMDGNVMMRNGRSRGYANPALIRNSYTMTQRGIFAVLSAGYRGLLPAQIDAWRNTSLDASDRFGQAIVVKGKELYVRLNANLIDIGATTISSPPVFTAVPAILSVTSFVVDASAQTAILGFANTPTAANVDHLLFATAPLSAGVTRPSKSAFRLVAVIPGGTASTFAFGTAYVTKFGSLLGSTGNKVFIQLYGVENTTGQKVPSVGASTVVVP